ncbi:DUF1294 domain-containing protein [Corticibacter populi]|uniref:DUF1294 domain-containing protein n=1 Tax=Corticibacter populi TaxID=1550736 RepID=A0A3M6QPU8_9BURK|nr:DUF1294 domain-containing protein [Corticibacter populi]RMX05055.1 DUF1294 domain-containing protein [Corticibacter populi]RZS33836.1 uncharacterized membrane protein YsdA (DUF1294 family) [Corticibacter populi]
MPGNTASGGSARVQGIVSGWNDEKGYGFVTAQQGGAKAFLHIKALSARGRRPFDGDLLSYELQRDARGRWQAERAMFVQAAPPAQQARHTGAAAAAAGSGMASQRLSAGQWRTFAAALGLLVVAVLAAAGLLHWSLLPWCLFASLITYGCYAHDKAAAQQGAWRTKESTLQILALVGGWPGALLAQQRLRHKSRKRDFQFVFWCAVLANLAAVVWLCTAAGRQFVDALLQML